MSKTEEASLNKQSDEIVDSQAEDVVKKIVLTRVERLPLPH